MQTYRLKILTQSNKKCEVDSIKKNNSKMKNEYDLDYSKAKPNRFSNLIKEKVLLHPIDTVNEPNKYLVLSTQYVENEIDQKKIKKSKKL
jgi:hypothetical protein